MQLSELVKLLADRLLVWLWGDSLSIVRCRLRLPCVRDKPVAVAARLEISHGTEVMYQELRPGSGDGSFIYAVLRFQGQACFFTQITPRSDASSKTCWQPPARDGPGVVN
jgi:hypothetical protein